MVASWQIIRSMFIWTNWPGLENYRLQHVLDCNRFLNLSRGCGEEKLSIYWAAMVKRVTNLGHKYSHLTHFYWADEKGSSRGIVWNWSLELLWPIFRFEAWWPVATTWWQGHHPSGPKGLTFLPLPKKNMHILLFEVFWDPKWNKASFFKFLSLQGHSVSFCVIWSDEPKVQAHTPLWLIWLYCSTFLWK